MTQSWARRFELLDGMAHSDLLTYGPRRVSLRVRGGMPADEVRWPQVNIRSRLTETSRPVPAAASFALVNGHPSWVPSTADPLVARRAL
jgi:hypothetical protein